MRAGDCALRATRIGGEIAANRVVPERATTSRQRRQDHEAKAARESRRRHDVLLFRDRAHGTRPAPPRRMTLRARSCAAALVIAGVALYTQPAHADAAGAESMARASCTVTLGPSPNGVTLPANAPALLVVDQTNDPTFDPIIKQAELVNGTARTGLSVVTDSHGLWTLALPEPSLSAGKYSVEIATSCPQYSEELNVVSAVTLTAPVALPTSVGTLSHVPSDPPTGLDTIRFEPTPGMRAFMPAAQLSIYANDAKSTASGFGNSTAPMEFQVTVGSACVENGALHREKRIVKVRLEGAIAGVADSPASASIDVPVDCGAIKWTSGLGFDANGGATPTPTNGTTPTTASSSDSGCSASPVSHGGGASLLSFALGGLGLVALRRRRPRRTLVEDR
jgi:MYXO-CTERM domain-containing protein